MTRLRREHGSVGDLVQLAVPLCIVHLGQQLMSVVDSAMLGRYSDAALGGSGMASTVMFAFTMIGSGILMGLDTLVPQALGAGDQPRVRRLFHAGLRLAVLVALPMMALLYLLALVLPATRIDPAVADEGAAYLYARMFGVPPLFLNATLRSYLQAYRITRPIVLAMVIGNLVNAAAAYLLIFGDDGLARIGLPPLGVPALGTVGAGLATTVVSWCTTLIAALAVRSLHAERAAIPRDRDEERRLERSIFRLGLPVGLQLMAEVGIFALVGVLAGMLGTDQSAAHQTALALASFSFASAIGIGAATSVMVGRAVGAGDTLGGRRAGAIGITFGAMVMGTSGIVFLTIPGPIARLVTQDADVLAVAVPLLRVAAVFQLSDAIQAVAAGALRGTGDTRSTFIANLFGHYAIGLPLATILCFTAHLGAVGLWWGLSAGLTTVAIALSLRFWRITSKPIAVQR